MVKEAKSAKLIRRDNANLSRLGSLIPCITSTLGYQSDKGSIFLGTDYGRGIHSRVCSRKLLVLLKGGSGVQVRFKREAGEGSVIVD